MEPKGSLLCSQGLPKSDILINIL